MNKRVFGFLLVFAAFSGLAMGQSYTCNATSSPQPLRADGIAEYTADVVIVCSGGSVGFSNPPQSISITLNANITSTVISGGSEAILLIDEPTSSNRFLGSNIFTGVQTASNTITFS